MAEAEDVLLSAAERVTNATRRVFASRRGADRSESDATSAMLRLDRWLVACFGRSLPIALCDRPAHVGWLRRALDRPAPWQIAPPPVAATDGACLFLPRETLDSETALLVALALGRRLSQERDFAPQESRLLRDVRWVLEA